MAACHLCVKREPLLIIAHSSLKTLCIIILICLNTLVKENGGGHAENFALSQ